MCIITGSIEQLRIHSTKFTILFKYFNYVLVLASVEWNCVIVKNTLRLLLIR